MSVQLALRFDEAPITCETRAAVSLDFPLPGREAISGRTGGCARDLLLRPPSPEREIEIVEEARTAQSYDWWLLSHDFLSFGLCKYDLDLNPAIAFPYKLCHYSYNFPIGRLNSGRLQR
jgi:hypothetical protein